MQEQFFDVVYKYGLLKKNNVDKRLIESMPARKIKDFIHEFKDATRLTHFERRKSIWSHSASLSLSGFSWPCANLNCRLTRMKQLGQFAALYSDNIFIKNLMDVIPTDYETHEEDNYKKIFYDNLSLLASVKPLIEKGYITVLSTGMVNYCPGCHAFLLPKDDKDLEVEIYSSMENDVGRNSYKILSQYMLDNTTVSISFINGQYFFRTKAPEYIIEHGERHLYTDKLPAPLDTMNNIQEELKSGKTISLSKSLIEKIGWPDRYLNNEYNSVGFGLVAAQCIGTSFLTEKELHISILNNMSDIPYISKRNNLIQKYITTFVPYINDLSISDVIKIRERENESFIMFRNSLGNAVDEYKKNKDNITEEDAMAIYNDLILPKITKLDLSVNKAKRKFTKSVGRKVASCVGAISFGIYSGFFKSDIINIAASLGLAKIVADLLEHTMEKSDSEESVKSEDIYFLWKVRELSKINKNKELRNLTTGLS